MAHRPEASSICEKIGEGAFGVVWLCKATELPRSEGGITPIECAAKLLKYRHEGIPGFIPSKEEIADFLREEIIMSSFNHENVVKLLAVSLTPSCYFTVSEYMNRGDSKHLLVNDIIAGREWTLEEKVSCARQTAEGLFYLHVEKSFVHRDVAARNILVQENCSGERAYKLTDFGMSRDVYQSGYYRGCKDKKRLLPVKWMALESLEYRIYNQQTDVWGFGVLLYEVFSMGRIPYPGVNNINMPEELEAGLRLDSPTICPAPMCHDGNNRDW
jgi:serine/threonine protein kinase